MTYPTVRLRFLLSRNDGGVWGKEPSGDNDSIVLRSTDQTIDGHWTLSAPAVRGLNSNERTAARLAINDLLVTKTSGSSAHIGKTTLVNAEIAATGACFGNFMQRLRVGSRMLPRFLWYLMNLQLVRNQFVLLSTTTTGLSNLSARDISQVAVPTPPLDDQRAIVDYLDQETDQIDALVAKQEEFIGLLRERRTHAREVLASHVSNGPRLRWTLHEVDVRAGTQAAELPLFSVSIDWGVRRRDETTDKLSRAEELDHYKVCLKGDIVINRMRAFQGALGVAPADGIVSPDYAVLRAKHDVDSEWLAELMRTKAFVSEIIQRLRGIGGRSSGNVRTPRINTADLLDIRALIPTVMIQQAELTTLTRDSKRIDALIAKAEEHIALAKERRSALITAAVTGQFDVRTAKNGARA